MTTVMTRFEDVIGENRGRAGANLCGYDGIARGIPFSLSMISGGERMKDDMGSEKYFMQMRDFL